MVRRRMTLKRIDPWSILKFGFIANLALLAIALLGATVVWFFVRRLRLIDKVCEIALDVGFVDCGVNGGNLFRAMLLLGLLGVVVQTGLLVFFAFLFNLIADLVGGIGLSVLDDTPVSTTTTRTVASRSGDASDKRGPPAPLGPERNQRESAPVREREPASRAARASAGATTSIIDRDDTRADDPSRAAGVPNSAPAGVPSSAPARTPSSAPARTPEPVAPAPGPPSRPPGTTAERIFGDRTDRSERDPGSS